MAARFWSKNPPWYLTYYSQARFLILGLPYIIVFALLEIAMATRRKDVILFVLPYKEFCENTRYLFEHYLINNDTRFTPYLFVYDRALYELLRGRYPERVLYARSRKAFWAFFRCFLCFTSRGSLASLFRPYCFLPPWKHFVNLWHGIPLKRLGTQARKTWERHISWELQSFAGMIACSKLEQLALSACYGFNIDDIWITNTPRNDTLFRRSEDDARNKRIILYAPTWRDGDVQTRLFPFPDKDLAQLDALLEREGYTMIVRPHLVDVGELAPEFEGYHNIRLDDRGSEESLQALLLETQILVTDYSSIYLDFLILNRPVVFIPYDQTYFDERRGFLFDYEAVTPGPKVFTFKDFVAALRRYMEDPTTESAARISVRDMFHTHRDGLSCERIAAISVRYLV